MKLFQSYLIIVLLLALVFLSMMQGKQGNTSDNANIPRYSMFKGSCNIGIANICFEYWGMSHEADLNYECMKSNFGIFSETEKCSSINLVGKCELFNNNKSLELEFIYFNYSPVYTPSISEASCMQTINGAKANGWDGKFVGIVN